MHIYKYLGICVRYSICVRLREQTQLDKHEQVNFSINI